MSGRLIATVGDQHICPMVTGTTAHVGGTIITGASNVLLNNKPIARMGDKCICTGCGMIATIIQGDASVLIDGKPVATVGCMTSHGGVITTGQANAYLEASSGATAKSPQIVTIPIELMPMLPARNLLDGFFALKSPKKAKESTTKKNELKKHGYLIDIDFSI